MAGSHRPIVVGVDASPCSRRALEWAAEEARRRALPLRVVHAWVYPMAPGYAFTATVHDVRGVAQEVLDRAVAQVRQLAPEIDVTGELVESLPAPALVAAAQDAELLVVGSRGHGGFEGLLLGSVSRYCARHATCSTVVVR
jgi:nucleotide-binding universal stress UspA family protein